MKENLFCPTCKTKNAKLLTKKDKNTSFYWVRCQKCGTQTFSYNSKNEALRHWNIHFLEEK